MRAMKGHEIDISMVT